MRAGQGVSVRRRISASSRESIVRLRRVRREVAEEHRPAGTEYAVRSTTPLVTASTTSLANPLPLPNKPSIAVLPFQNMSGDPEQEYFADGIVEDIITALSRFKSLFVIARNSSFTYKRKAVDIKQVGRELGVRYVLEGSVRKAAGKVRITGQLIDTATGTHLWADRFDGLLEDIFELQDKITTSVVGAIAPKIEHAEIERARRKPAESLEAYDFYLRGMSRMQVSNKEALHLFYRAIELDPDFATPYGLAARCYAYRAALHRIVDREGEIAEVRRLSKRVVETGQDDALALTFAGLALVELCREYESGEALIDPSAFRQPEFGDRLDQSRRSQLLFGTKRLCDRADFPSAAPQSPRLRELSGRIHDRIGLSGQR